MIRSMYVGRAVLAILLFWLVPCGCKKTQLSLLPPATSSGRNTFGCLIDGEAFVAKDNIELFGNLKGINVEPTTFSDSPLITGFYIEANAKSGNGKRSVRLTITTSGSNKNPILNGSHGNSLHVNQMLNDLTALTDSIHQGSAHISRFDQHVVSGTFEGVLITRLTQTPQLVHITQGRFDISY